MEKQLQDQTILISGASSGIGEACAYHCAKAGANLILAARRLEKMNQLAKRIRDEYQVNVHILKLDVRNHASIQTTIQNLPPEWKKIDALINNAGLAMGFDPLYEMPIDDFDAVIDTNIKGLFYLTRAVVPAMIARNKGHIINLGSISGHETYAGGVAYCATKHAVTALTQGLKKDLLGTTIRVSLISPGMVETEFSEVRFKNDVSRAKAVYEGMTPLSAKDIAECVVFSLTRPAHVNISEILVFPVDQASTTMIHRN